MRGSDGVNFANLNRTSDTGRASKTYLGNQFFPPFRVKYTTLARKIDTRVEKKRIGKATVDMERLSGRWNY